MRFAVLGCGSIGRRHLSNLQTLGESDLIAYEPVSDRRAVIASEFGVAVYDDLKEVWGADPDVALVTSPTSTHLDLALEAAKQGCHLFIEKPLAHTLAGLDELFRLVAEKGLVTLVGCNMRFHPGPERIKRWLDEGRIGRPLSARLHTGSYMPEWRPGVDYRTVYSASPEEGGGAIFDQIHELDLAFWLFGPFAEVEGMVVKADWLGLEVEGIAEVLGRHRSGMLSSIHLNFVQRDYHRSIRVIGESGSLHWDFNVPVVRVYDAEAQAWEEVETADRWEINDMYMAEMAHFLDCLARLQPTCCPAEQGGRVLEVALAVKRAARERQAVSIGGRE